MSNYPVPLFVQMVAKILLAHAQTIHEGIFRFPWNIHRVKEITGGLNGGGDPVGFADLKHMLSFFKAWLAELSIAVMEPKDVDDILELEQIPEHYIKFVWTLSQLHITVLAAHPD
jgi:hypothetical protein